MDKKKSPQSGKGHSKKGAHAASDSDASAETNSLSAESATELVTAKPKSKKDRRRSSEWEIMEGLKEGQKFEKKPLKFDGYLHKKRKWPLKGWHKVGIEKFLFAESCSLFKYALVINFLYSATFHNEYFSRPEFF